MGMSLRDRLRSMQGTTAPQTDAATRATEAAADVDAAAGDPQTAVADHADVSAVGRAPGALKATQAGYGPETLLPGAVCETPYGCCYVAEWRYPLAHQHGHAAIGATCGISMIEASSLLTRSARERSTLSTVDPGRIVYLDTETTGLAGGTGTYAFLVGVARFVCGELVVRQLFMRTLSEERALLHLLAHELSTCDVLVTYNGKTFDWPLLETRFALGRRQGPRRPPDPAAHVDLLFAARRLWRGRLEGCTLNQVEREVLGVRRGEDTPGWLIPQLYFAYLRSQDVRPLVGVFRHNALDVVSLAALLGRVAAIGTAERSAGATPADELLGLGRCLEEAGEAARALGCYEAALGGAGLTNTAVRESVVYEARMRAGLLLKRMRRASDALSHWEALAADQRAGHGALDVRPYEELAKYYEHVAREHAVARTYVLAALEALRSSPGAPAVHDQKRLRHRLSRLERAMGRVATATR